MILAPAQQRPVLSRRRKESLPVVCFTAIGQPLVLAAG